MALFIDDNTGEVTFRFSLLNDPEVMTTSIGVMVDGTPSQPDVSDACIDVGAIWESAWGWDGAAGVSDDYTYLGYDYKYRHGGTLFEGEVPSNIVGTFNAFPLPNNCTWLVQKRTGFLGRAYRGRMYIPMVDGLTEGEVSPTGVIDTASITPRNTLLAGILTSVAALTDVSLALLHTETAPGVGLAATPINAMTVDTKIATQRRRMRY